LCLEIYPLQLGCSYYRSIRLPEAADENSIKVKMKDGVLKVSVKFKELPKPKQIAIEA
jgi:HSP20 family molecular chaperone IbpA